ncbi:alpha/beta hydrolase-fold protein [Alteromonadaceae bacterium BrNp21-10]|nr:alpha/beta hydrolase-fold protein [Alteromonadaceae bacterium BrNp21-10]
MKNIIGILLTFFSLYCTADIVDQGPVSLNGTVSHVMYSEKIQQHFLIDIFLPQGYQEKKSEYQFPKYPVIYVLNSRPNAVMLATMRNFAQMNREIIVGIGYADEKGKPSHSFAAYTRDLTPNKDEHWMGAKTAGTGGGAKNFLDFINTQVKPFINKTYTVNKHNQTLVGHSFAGLFGLYTLFTQPDSFDRYVIASPSLWWGNGIGFELEKHYASTNTNLSKKLFLAVGGAELNTAPEHMLDNTQLIFEKLQQRKYPNLELSYKVFEDATHQSVVADALNKGVEAVFQ